MRAVLSFVQRLRRLPVPGPLGRLLLRFAGKKIWHHSADAKFPMTHHRQDTKDDCGLACAQMLMWSYSGKLEKYEVQVELRELVNDRGDTVWGAQPQKFVSFLRDLIPRPGTSDRQFELFACSTEKCLTQNLVHSLVNGNFAAPVVVDGHKHWVVAYACDLDSPPQGPPYAVRALYVHDPAGVPIPVRIEDVGPVLNPETLVHKGPDDEDICGKGMLRLQPRIPEAYENRGLAYRRLNYDYWKAKVLTGIPQNITGMDAKLAGTFAAVLDVTNLPRSVGCKCDTLPLMGAIPVPITCGGVSTPLECSGNNLPEWAVDRRKFTESLEQTICDLTEQYLRDEGLLPDGTTFKVDGVPKLWRELLKDTQAVAVHPVGPPGGRGFYYYLVEMVRNISPSSEERPVVVLVNACKGCEKVLEMAATTTDGKIAIKFIDPQAIRQAAIASERLLRVNINGRFARVDVNEENISLAEDFQLVWQPSPLSLSPYMPFYRFTITVRGTELELQFPPPPPGATFEVPFYVRADFWDWSRLFPLGSTGPTGPLQPLDTGIFTTPFQDL